MDKNSDFFCVYKWMAKDLSGCELSTYALIFGFSRDTDKKEGWFYGSIDCISSYTGYSRRATISALKRLCEKGLLLKIEQSGGTCMYKAKIPPEVWNGSIHHDSNN